MSHFTESLLIYLRVFGRDSLTLLKEYLKVPKVLLQNIFTPINIGLTLQKSFRLKIVSLLLSLLSVWRRIAVVCRVLSLNVISKPLFEHIGQGHTQQLLVYHWQLWVNFDAVVVFENEFLAEGFVDLGIVYDELVVAGLEVR